MVYDDIALNSGVIFMHTVDVLKEKANGVNIKPENGIISISPLDLALNVPIIVNSALACELIIKSMLPKKPQKEHNHKNLFEKLDYDIQEKVRNLTIKKMQKTNTLYAAEDFNCDLNQNKLNFFEWRYFHEGISHTANFLFIENFMNALFEIAKAERKK